MKIKFIIVIGLIIVLTVSIIFLYPYLIKKLYHIKTNWELSDLHIKDRQPYGMYYVYRTLKKGIPKTSFKEISKSLASELDVSDSESVYMLIGKNLYFNDADLDTLKAFVANGNDAFISAQNLNKLPGSETNFLQELLMTENLCSNSSNSQKIEVRFITENPEKVYEFHYPLQDKKMDYEWFYFIGCNNEDSVTIYPESYFDDHLPIMISKQYGKGTIYLHLNPIMFTNYFFIEQQGKDYLNVCFKPFTRKKIYWDQASKTPKEVKKNDEKGSSPAFLNYIFDRRELSFAWHVMLAGVLLFLLFRTKRRQRVIPVMARPKNKSAGYVNSVASLYYQKYNHKHIASEMLNQFINYLSTKYSIKVNINNFMDHLPEIEEASGISSNDIYSIFVKGLELEADSHNNTNLLKLNKLLNNFYNNSN